MFAQFFRRQAKVPESEFRGVPESSLPQEEIKSLQRTLRKASTLVEEHIETLRGFTERFDIMDGGGAPNESAWFAILDRMYQIHEALRSERHGLSAALFIEIAEIERLAQLTPIARYDQSIDPAECQAVGTVDVDAVAHGMVQSIVRQGYRRSNGSVVREAVIILGRYRQGEDSNTSRVDEVMEAVNG